jgi:hypothetical protein
MLIVAAAGSLSRLGTVGSAGRAIAELRQLNMKKINAEFIRAILRNDLAGVERCLGKKAEANLRDSDSIPILFHAACRGQAAVVACLIAAGADPRATEPNDGRNALGYMLHQHMVGVPANEAANTVRLLLRRGLVADQRPSPNYLSPWWSALVQNHPTIMQAMIEFGTDVNKPLTAENFTPLTVAGSERTTVSSGQTRQQLRRSVTRRCACWRSRTRTTMTIRGRPRQRPKSLRYCAPK